METPVAEAERSVTVSRLEEVFRAIVDHAGAKLVFGERVVVEGKTILPVATIRYGFGGGSGRKGNEGHGGGGGGGLVAKPVGVVEITQTETRFIPITTSGWPIIAAVALGICLGFAVVPKRQR